MTMPNKFKLQPILTSREFRYSKGTTNLKFSLNLDNKNEMKEFKELLEKALKDVEVEITKDTLKVTGSELHFAGASGAGTTPIERKLL